MKNVKALLTMAGLLFLVAGVLAGGTLIQSPQNVTERAAASTNLSISPTSQNVTPGGNVTFSVRMDTGTNQVIGLDLLLNFDPNILQVSSLQRGADTTSLNNTISNNFDDTAGNVSYSIFTLDKTQTLAGSNLEVLKINARIKNNAPVGGYLLTFDPSTAVSGSNETQNVITGAIPGTIVVTNQTPTPLATAAVTPTASPTISPTNTPTPEPGQPNSCGGTCGSNSNCGANLFCYQGYCRNPSCSWSTDCSCNSATGTPSPVPTWTSTAGTVTTKPKATASPINLTPKPTVAANNFWENVFTTATSAPVGVMPASPTLAPLSLPFSKNGNFLPWIIGSLIVAGVTLVLIVIGIQKQAGIHNRKPPVIKV